VNENLENLTDILLMGPGPSSVPPSVYQALAAPTVGHLDPRFIHIMDDIKNQLKVLLNTQNPMTLPMSGTGSAGMETCFVNLIEPGDQILILSNGVFGTRMQDVAARCGGIVKAIEYEWGSPVDPADAQRELSRKQYKIVALVHAETSTGVLNPAKEIGEIVQNRGPLYLLDTVTSLGGIKVDVDTWGVDALYSGTQKCLSCPPGLAPVSFSPSAEKALDSRKSKVSSWYLDLSMIKNYWEGAKRSYHHTAPINMLYGLHEALTLYFQEGAEQVHARHQDAYVRLTLGLEERGFDFLVEKNFRLPMLNAVVVPEGIDEVRLRSELLMDHNIEIGAGLGPLAGKIWRIGLMGHTARAANVDRFLEALDAVLE
jgi:alanine-glyoxylate transaminase / serine-glyoxylate transaminase / serine-pyruvate transaminase